MNVVWVPIERAVIVNYKTYWLNLTTPDSPLPFTAYGIRKGNGKWYWDEDSEEDINANVVAIAEFEWPDPYLY